MDATPAKNPFWKKPMGIALIIIAIIAVLAIIGNQLPDVDESTATPTASATAKQTEPEVSGSSPEGEDITESLKQALPEYETKIVSAIDTGKSITVETTWIDPREDDSAEAKEAIQFCTNVHGQYPDRNIDILEHDQTHWIIYRNEKFMNYPIKECFEY